MLPCGLVVVQRTRKVNQPHVISLLLLDEIAI